VRIFSRTDFRGRVATIDWGWSIADTATRFDGTKQQGAEESGEAYPLNTAGNAAAAGRARIKILIIW
jgi:hypothetical protein